MNNLHRRASPTAEALLAKRELAQLNGGPKRQAFRGEGGGGVHERERESVFVDCVCL